VLRVKWRRSAVPASMEGKFVGCYYQSLCILHWLSAFEDEAHEQELYR
jgi:hypothetical protein